MACNPRQVPSHRYVTTENIHAGDIILEEEPWIWGLLCLQGKFTKNGPEKMVCHYCMLSPGSMLRCSGCKSAWYCNATCQRADWALRHKHGDCCMQQYNAGLELRVRAEEEPNFEREFLHVIRRCLLLSASTRLFSTQDRDENGNPDTALWRALMDSPSNTDGWVDANPQPLMANDALQSHPHAYLNRQLIIFTQKPNEGTDKRILPSLVLMRDYGSWKKLVESMQLPTTTMQIAELAFGACLEMSKFPNNCNPNAVIINEGRLVRMIALEDIPDLDAVRLWRGTCGWLETARFDHRTQDLYDTFGYNCHCSRCCAGDDGENETAMYGLRCPSWAAAYNSIQNRSTGCDSIVIGLRRSDIEKFSTPENSGVVPGAEAIDELVERVECQKCHAHYDKSIMKLYVMKCLAFLAQIKNDIEGLKNYNNFAVNEVCMEMAGCAEQYIHPSNYVYTTAEFILLGPCVAMLKGTVRLDIKSLAWLQRSARRMVARMDGDGFKQLDVPGVFRVAELYSVWAQHLRQKHIPGRIAGGARETNLYEQTAVLFIQVATAAMAKLKPLLNH